MGESRRFRPAAGHDWLLPLYDPFQRLFGAQPRRKTRSTISSRM
jgi:hypothetical protein